MKVREGYYSEQIRNASFADILPKLNRMQLKVYHYIQNYGPCTTEEIALAFEVYPHTITPRVKELREQGLVEFYGTTVSIRTGRTVSLWKARQQPQQLQLL